MKARVCRVCAISGIFCENCEEKLRSSIITEQEIEVAKILYEMEGKFKELHNISLESVAELSEEDLAVIIFSNEYLNPVFISTLSKALSNKIEKNVKVVEKTSDIKKFITQFLSPIKVLSINEVWAPDGSHEYAIRISYKESKKSLASKNDIERILSNLLSSNVRIILE